MSEQQPLSQPLQTEELLLNDQEMQFWLDKAVAWGQADSPDTQKDTCLHMSRLRDFLHQLLTQVNSMVSTKSVQWGPCEPCQAAGISLRCMFLTNVDGLVPTPDFLDACSV